MGATEELLANMKDDAKVINYITIDSESRKILLPQNEIFGVETDKDAERKYFKCKKIVGDNIDLSECNIYVSYAKAEGNKVNTETLSGLSLCNDVKIENEYITFSWLLSENAMRLPGTIAFKIFAKKNENDTLKIKWNTATAFARVLETFLEDENYAESYPDVFNQIVERINKIEEKLNKLSSPDIPPDTPSDKEIESDNLIIPDLYNTGIKNNSALTEVNSTTTNSNRIQMTQSTVDRMITDANVIENYYFNEVYLDFNKEISQTLTFRNCKFAGDGEMSYAVAVTSYGLNKGIIFENCEFTNYKSAVTAGTWKATFDKCYVHDMPQDALKSTHSEIYYKNCYIHSLGTSPTAHADGVQAENNSVDITIHIYNCRFDQPFTSNNLENAAIFAKCKDANIILDIQSCYANGGNYTIYALDGDTKKVSGSIECIVGCSAKYSTTNISSNVNQEITAASKLFVSTVQDNKAYVTNYTNQDRVLKVVTNAGETTVTIKKCPTYSENHIQPFSEYPFNVPVEFPKEATWAKFYDGDTLIRTQNLSKNI